MLYETTKLTAAFVRIRTENCPGSEWNVLSEWEWPWRSIHPNIGRLGYSPLAVSLKIREVPKSWKSGRKRLQELSNCQLFCLTAKGKHVQHTNNAQRSDLVIRAHKCTETATICKLFTVYVQQISWCSTINNPLTFNSVRSWEGTELPVTIKDPVLRVKTCCSTHNNRMETCKGSKCTTRATEKWRIL